MFYLLAIYVLGWGFTSYPSVFLGLIFGTSLSLFNFWLLARRMRTFGDSVIQGKKVRSLGSLSRMAVAAFAVIISSNYPEQLNLISVIIGLMTSYVVIMIDFFIHSFRLHE